MKLPKSLRYWYEQHLKEGENPQAAWIHAINRCYESGDISDKQADKYESIPAPEMKG